MQWRNEGEMLAFLPHVSLDKICPVPLFDIK